MKPWIHGLAIALLLTACHGQADEAKTTPSDAEVQAGTTKDSASAELNALQRTKRTMGKIESEHKAAVEGAEGDGQ